jgi:hypothetical protein
MRAARAERLDAQTWGGHTATFRALDFSFAVRTTDPALGGLLDDLYASCAIPAEPPAHRYTLRERTTRNGARFTLYCDDERVVTTPAASIALDHLVWDANRRAIDSVPSALVLHAGAVSVDGAAVLLPAPSGAGKSTLTAGLVQRGFDYVTDEACALDPAAGTVRPYPKPIALERGAWHLFDALEPSRYTALTQYRTAAGLGSTPAGGPVVPRLVVTPRYVRGGPGAARPISRATALVRLADQSFNFDTFGPARLPLLARLVEGASCFELDVDDLDEAATTIRTLLADARVRA